MKGKSQWSIILIILTVTLSYLFHDTFIPNESPVIQISSGKVQGIVSKARNGELYYEFLGIPYGQPTMGDLRFESPLPAKPWEGVMNVKSHGPECMQLEVMVTGRILGSEDCLRLNVYSPKTNRMSSRLLPVMVFIHGGLFMAGSSNWYRAKYFMETQDIILVTLNYRVGSLGFLSTNDEIVKGNMGLKDQRLALKWVQKNIKAFGGDPSKVTLFGESAGGASVHYHILSASSKGLFQRALSQSGTSLKPWALNRDPARQAYLYGKKFNCPTNSSYALVSCLRKIDAKSLVLANLGVMSPILRAEDAFGPTVETVIDKDTFLKEDPMTLVMSGKFSTVPWMLGVNKGEGLFNIGRLISDTEILSQLDKDWNTLAPLLLSYNQEDRKASEEIKSYYFGSSIQNSMSTIGNLTELFSDRNFFHATHTASIYHASKSPVYLYYLSYQGDISLYKLMKWINPVSWVPVEVQVVLAVGKELFYKYVLGYTEQNLGPSHADELVLLFNMHFFAEVFQSSRDREMSRSLIKLWTSFAKDEKLSYQGTRWDPISISNNQTVLQYLQIDKTSRMIDEPFYNRIRFWERLNI